MAFCSNCGNQVEGEFCPECGAKIEEENVVVQPEETVAAPAPAVDPEVIEKVKKIAIPVVIVAVVVAVAVFVITTFFNPVKNITNKYMKAFKAGEGEKIVATMYPDMVAYYDEKYSESEYIDYDTMAEQFDESYESMSDYYADEEDIDLSKIKWEITKVKDVKKGQLKDIQKFYEEVCDAKVSAAKIVKIKMTDDDEKATIEKCVIKVGMKWYVADASAGSYEDLLESYKAEKKLKDNE